MGEADVEALLRGALRPVEPQESLAERLERRLVGVRSAAVDELADWELRALRDPRRWLRALIAVICGAAAATALALLRLHQARRSRPRGLAATAERLRSHLLRPLERMQLRRARGRRRIIA